MKTTIATLSTAVLAGLLLASAGCSGSKDSDALSEKLVGRWEGQITPEIEAGGAEVTMMNGEDFPVSMEFRQDGTMSMDLLFPMSGTWEPLRSEGDQLTIKAVVDTPSLSFEFSSEQTGDEEPTTTERTEMSTSPETWELTIVFETDDRIRITKSDDPEPMTLHRQR